MTNTFFSAYCFTSTSQDGFRADPAWVETLIEKGVICRDCRNILPGKEEFIEFVQVLDSGKVKSHSAVVGGFTPNEVLSVDLLEALGRNRVNQLGRLVPLETGKGKKYSSHLCLIASQLPSRGLIRSKAAPQVSLCKLCRSCVKYWPGWPPKTWQILRSDWPAGREVAWIGFGLFCTPDFWDEDVAPLKLPKLKADKVAIIDAPEDGLPASFESICDTLYREGRFCAPEVSRPR